MCIYSMYSMVPLMPWQNYISSYIIFFLFQITSTSELIKNCDFVHRLYSALYISVNFIHFNFLRRAHSIIDSTNQTQTKPSYYFKILLH